MSKNKTVRTSSCKICGSETQELHDSLIKVTYDVCQKCDFIYKQTRYHLPNDLEKERYDTHNNDTEDEGYKNIFRNLLETHVRPLKNVKSILDFGSGPYPMLQKIFEQEGYEVTIYDYYYHKDSTYLNQKYDLITSTEVIEHLSEPLLEIEKLVSLLKDQGYLALMTNFRTMNLDAFLSWWYKRDHTHIAFFNQKTFDYLKERFHLVEVSNNHKNIIVLQKK